MAQLATETSCKRTRCVAYLLQKDSGKTRVSYEDAVEEALCFGWIDSIMKPVDEEKYAQKFTPEN